LNPGRKTNGFLHDTEQRSHANFRGSFSRGDFLLSPGMRGKVVSLHDGFHLDMVKGSILPRALVEFENGMRLLVDQRMKWEKMLSIEEGGTK